MDKINTDSLVNNNINLVYYIANKLFKSNNIPRNEEDDILSEGSIGLVKAAKSYDSNKGVKFSTYASKCIQLQMLYYIRRVKRHWYLPSLDDKISNELVLGDMILDNSIDIVESLIETDYNNLLTIEIKKLPERYRIVMENVLNGRTQSEIAKDLGVSRSRVSHIYNRGIELIKSNIHKIEYA